MEAHRDDGWTHEAIALELEQKEKKSFIDGLVVSILGMTAMANMAYAIIAPFLPFEFKKKGID